MFQIYSADPSAECIRCQFLDLGQFLGTGQRIDYNGKKDHLRTVKNYFPFSVIFPYLFTYLLLFFLSCHSSDIG